LANQSHNTVLQASKQLNKDLLLMQYHSNPLSPVVKSNNAHAPVKPLQQTVFQQFTSMTNEANRVLAQS
jgi:hypothetical protein